MSRPRQSVAAELEVRDLGRMPYAEALQLQRRLQAQVIAGRARPGAPMHLLLVEHDPPVITVSRRRGARTHLLAAPESLAREGVEVAETDRGGDITYHGPGQLVAYPILDLNVLGLRLHSYMRFLEQIVIDTIEAFGVTGHRDACATGVWVGDGADARKICAMGVRVSRWVSMHGLALNVTTNLEHFELIVPCGLVGREVTSLARETGEQCPSMDEVKRTLVERLLREMAPGSA
ncbi:MAG: lipoyl(octanoyl) transferase LipB [Planctomycetes bacterium]|nr:lipoyl(octanoyl) transferase LipB [Planctomycetota bacterium]